MKEVVGEIYTGSSSEDSIGVRSGNVFFSLVVDFVSAIGSVVDSGVVGTMDREEGVLGVGLLSQEVFVPVRDKVKDGSGGTNFHSYGTRKGFTRPLLRPLFDVEKIKNLKI